MLSNHKHTLETFSEEGGLLFHRPKSLENRLILHFTARHYCRHGIGLHDMNLPTNRHDLGVDEYEWNNMMQKLQKEVQSFAPSYCCLKFYRILAFLVMFC